MKGRVKALSVAADICNQLLGRHYVELAETDLAALRNQMADHDRLRGRRLLWPLGALCLRAGDING